LLLPPVEGGHQRISARGGLLVQGVPHDIGNVADVVPQTAFGVPSFAWEIGVRSFIS